MQNVALMLRRVLTECGRICCIAEPSGSHRGKRASVLCEGPRVAQCAQRDTAEILRAVVIQPQVVAEFVNGDPEKERRQLVRVKWQPGNRCRQAALARRTDRLTADAAEPSEFAEPRQCALLNREHERNASELGEVRGRVRGVDGGGRQVWQMVAVIVLGQGERAEDLPGGGSLAV